MSNGQNTNNVGLAIGLLAQLLASAGTITAAIQTAQASGVDITDDQLDAFTQDYQDAGAQLEADILSGAGYQPSPAPAPVISAPNVAPGQPAPQPHVPNAGTNTTS